MNKKIKTFTSSWEGSLFEHKSDGSAQCLECDKPVVLPFQANSREERIGILKEHATQVHKYGGDEADNPSTRNKMIKREYEKQVEKMGDLVEEEK